MIILKVIGSIVGAVLLFLGLLLCWRALIDPSPEAAGPDDEKIAVVGAALASFGLFLSIISFRGL